MAAGEFGSPLSTDASIRYAFPSLGARDEARRTSSGGFRASLRGSYKTWDWKLYSGFFTSHSKRRIVHAADQTGRELQRVLLKEARARANIRFLPYPP